MGILGVLDNVQRNLVEIPPIRAYTHGTLETAEVLETWPFVEEVESTPARPYVSHLLVISSKSMHIRSAESWKQGTATAINHDVHERVIREYLREYGCEVELGTELIGLEQDDEGVNVKVRRLQGEDGAPHDESIRASYAIGADGARGKSL